MTLQQTISDSKRENIRQFSQAKTQEKPATLEPPTKNQIYFLQMHKIKDIPASKSVATEIIKQIKLKEEETQDY